uniref:Sulfhydryl oxidase n=1 Tax=Plectus sambesii TaxID=2011161 RepID=A0A914XE73_9BILA
MLNLFIHFLFFIACDGQTADFGHVPNGVNPTLYESSDPIIQLDEDTFSTTVYNASTSFVVEFYADWCGHCREFATEFKSFANDVKEWAPVVKVAALNCGDPYNERTCGQNGISAFPNLKYFHRMSSGPEAAEELGQSKKSEASLLSSLIELVESESRVQRYLDWPNLELIEIESTPSDLWSKAPESSEYLAVIFEEEELQQTSIKLILDLSIYQSQLAVRRSSVHSKIANSLNVREPTVVVFARNESRMQHIHPESAYESLKNLATTGDTSVSLSTTSTAATTTTTTIPPWSCRIRPDKCKELYFVSETDMLKAIRYALYNDVPRAGGMFSGTNLTALRNFVSLLAENFPTQESRRESPDKEEISKTNASLSYSSRARQLFVELQQYLEYETANSGSLPIARWQRQYLKTERQLNLSSFSANSEWQHCRGSVKHLRGYTCGLWTTFHALTVNAYLNNMHNASFEPLRVLQAIQGWVDVYFGCRYCRDHFMNMTINMESEVKRPVDVVLYLWKAHNIVNNRLKGDDTEDAEFPKYQFPAGFLCDNCTIENGTFHETQVTEYLLNYYSTITPHKDEQLHPFDSASSSSGTANLRFGLLFRVFLLVIMCSVL